MWCPLWPFKVGIQCITNNRNRVFSCGTNWSWGQSSTLHEAASSCMVMTSALTLGFYPEVRGGHSRTILCWLLTELQEHRCWLCDPHMQGTFSVTFWILLSHFFPRNRCEIPKQNEGSPFGYIASSFLLLDVLLYSLSYITHTQQRATCIF